MTSLNILESYPFTSADSTSWIMTTANGNIYTRFGTVCVSNVSSNKPNHISKLPKETQQQIEKDIEKYGVTLEQCMEDHKARAVVNVNYIQDWADNYQYKGNGRYQKRAGAGYNVPIVMDSLVGSIESDMGIKAT